MRDEGLAVGDRHAARGWRPSLLRLPAFLLLFVFLGGMYSVVTPPFEAPDEIWHFAVIHHLAQGHGLPVSEPNAQALWRQQGVQAPAYYLAAAALTAWIDTGDFPQVYARINPHRAIGLPDAQANRNFLLPYPEDGWPWAGTFLALHVVRFLSVGLAAVTLAATYAALRLVVDSHRAFWSTVLFGLIPQFLFIGGAAGNDNAVNALAALVLWRVVALVVAPPGPHAPERQRRDFLLLGGLLGVAVLTKLSALGLVGIVGIAVLGHAVVRRDWRVLAQAALWIGLPLLVIGGWWYLRNWRLYGDPLAWNIWQANIQLRVQPADWATIRGELGGLERSFWGLFGWMNVPYPEVAYSFFRGLSWMIGVGLVLSAAGWLRRGAVIDRRFWAGGLLCLWLVVLAVSWARFMEIAPAAQGRYFQPAAPTLALLMGLGLSGWRLWTLPGTVAVFLLALNLVTPWWVIAPAYAPPPSVTDVALEPVTVAVGESFAIRGVAAPAGPITPGERPEVVIEWEAVATGSPRRDYSVFVHLVDDEGFIIAQYDTAPGGGLLPTSRWEPGARYAERYPVHIPPTAYTPNRAVWAVGLYGGDELLHVGPIRGGPLPVRPLDGSHPDASEPMTALKFGAVEVAPPPGDAPNALHARFTGGIWLEGYTLNRRALRPGDVLEVALYWRSDGRLDQEYTIFVHLLDENLDGVGGVDRAPDVPTTAWTPGELYRHIHLLPIPEPAPGLYRLAVGMYGQADFQRLLLEDPGTRLGMYAEAQGADRYLLGPLRIDAP